MMSTVDDDNKKIPIETEDESNDTKLKPSPKKKLKVGSTKYINKLVDQWMEKFPVITWKPVEGIQRIQTIDGTPFHELSTKIMERVLILCGYRSKLRKKDLIKLFTRLMWQAEHGANPQIFYGDKNTMRDKYIEDAFFQDKVTDKLLLMSEVSSLKNTLFDVQHQMVYNNHHHRENVESLNEKIQLLTKDLEMANNVKQ